MTSRATEKRDQFLLIPVLVEREQNAKTFRSKLVEN